MWPSTWRARRKRGGKERRGSRTTSRYDDPIHSSPGHLTQICCSGGSSTQTITLGDTPVTLRGVTVPAVRRIGRTVPPVPDPLWTQVVATVTPEEVELAADRLWSFEPAAIEEVPEGDRVRLIAGYGGKAAAIAAADALRAEGWGEAEVRTVGDDELDRWRDHAQAHRAGPFLVIPAWFTDPDPEPDTTRLWIDPARSFGSASHPTTRLVLATLPDLLGPPGSPPAVLDVGCGSGILSVAAARLGAADVLGIDIDPEAPAVTAVNARRNGVEAAVRSSNEDLATIAASGATFGLVLANLLAPVLVELADALATVVAPGGHLVVSGLLEDRWSAATDHLDGFDVVAIRAEDDWAAISLRRRSDHPRSRTGSSPGHSAR